MSEIWLIRHGESLANAGMPTISQKSISLTPCGVKQAQAISNLFEYSPSLIVVSPHIRTNQTAQPIISRFPNTPVANWKVQEFTFLSPLRCKGTTICERQPWVDEYWTKLDPLYNDGEGAESFTDFINRVWRIVQYLQSSKHKFIAVFSHGLFIRAVIWAQLMNDKLLCLQSMDKFLMFCKSFEIENGAILKCFLRSDEIYFSKIYRKHLRGC